MGTNTPSIILAFTPTHQASCNLQQEKPRKKMKKQQIASLPISPFMSEEETTSMDPQNSSEEPIHPVGESVAPGHKRPKHHQPCEDRAEPHKPFDASHAESQSQSPVIHDESNHDETELQNQFPSTVVDVTKETIKTEALLLSDDSGRDRLKQHCVEVAGRVWIPETWGQEELMKDWIDCSVFDASLVSSRIISARAALMAEGRTPNPRGLKIGNRC